MLCLNFLKSEMKNIKYSIIIPHKNIPYLLERCLASIPDNDNFQIIIVDDNSDPKKVDFNNFPGVKRRNTEIYFDKQGKGAGYARNIGLKYAKGKWLIFADADDFFNDCFESAIEQNFNSSADIIYYSASSVNSNDLSPGTRHLGTERAIFNYVPLNNETVENVKFSNWEPWTRLFNHAFIRDNSITFDEVMVGNDAGFVLKAGYYSKTINVDTRPIYCVTYRNDSLSFVISEKAFDNRFKAKILVNNYMIDFGKKYFRPIKEEIIEAKKYGFIKTFKMIFIARRYIFHKVKLKLKHLLLMTITF